MHQYLWVPFKIHPHNNQLQVSASPFSHNQHRVTYLTNLSYATQIKFQILTIKTQKPLAEYIWIPNVLRGIMICQGNRSSAHPTHYLVGNNSVKIYWKYIFSKQCTELNSIFTQIYAIFRPLFFLFIDSKCHLFYPYNYFTHSQQQYHVLYIPYLPMNTTQFLTEE